MEDQYDADRQDREQNELDAKIRQAMAEEKLTHYSMSIVGDEIEAVIAAVNIGIDAHLEICNSPERGDSYQHGDRSVTATSDTEHWSKGDKLVFTQTLDCEVSAESLPVLLRRLGEAGSEIACSLRSAILSTLSLEE